jgi:hypothetical protein
LSELGSQLSASSKKEAEGLGYALYPRARSKQTKQSLLIILQNIIIKNKS